MTPIKVFFVEPTGTMMYSHAFKCEPCGHITRVDIGEITGSRLPRIEDWSKVVEPLLDELEAPAGHRSGTE